MARWGPWSYVPGVRNATSVGLVLIGTALLASGSGAASGTPTLAPCRPDDYFLHMQLKPGSAGTAAEIGIVRVDVPACTLASALQLTIRYRNGKLARTIRGNPGSWRTSGEL